MHQNHLIPLYHKFGSGGISKGNPLFVPETITSYTQVKQFLNILKPTQKTGIFSKHFNLSPHFVHSHQSYFFGYVLGVFIGDATKSKTSNKSMLTDISLSRKHPTNLDFGNFFSLCVNSYRYQLLKAFVEATTFQKATPLQKAQIRQEITKKLLKGEGHQSIAESILFSYNIRFNKDVIDTIKKHLRKKDGPYSRT